MPVAWIAYARWRRSGAFARFVSDDGRYRLPTSEMPELLRSAWFMRQQPSNWPCGRLLLAGRGEQAAPSNRPWPLGMVAVFAVQALEQIHQRKCERPDNRSNPRPNFEAASSTFSNSTGKIHRADRSDRQQCEENVAVEGNDVGAHLCTLQCCLGCNVSLGIPISKSTTWTDLQAKIAGALKTARARNRCNLAFRKARSACRFLARRHPGSSERGSG
jgi:hypothetical protein